MTPSARADAGTRAEFAAADSRVQRGDAAGGGVVLSGVLPFGLPDQK